MTRSETHSEKSLWLILILAILAMMALVSRPAS